jgi:pyruvate/2-oxoglutarate dehydrogenase complex dihydrolipoamide acyltransferase (E2) component
MSSEHIDVCVPSFGQSLSEALLVEWVVDVGHHVGRGDVVALVETDKTSAEIVAERDGRIAGHSAEAGTILKPGDVLYQLEAD